MNKQSNVYTLIYIIVAVVLVGAALAFTSMSLRDKQQANADADKMRQILMSVHKEPESSEVSSTFSELIVKQMYVNSEGTITFEAPEGDNTVFNTDVASQISLPATDRKLPVFVCQLEDGQTKYILPAYGAGLWGPIWGYIAVGANGSDIYGAYFSHASETPGLGSEIETPKFAGQFDNKHLIKDGRFIPVEVVKVGQRPTDENADYVDAISGGTITSKGVSAMLNNCLNPYSKFLENLSNK